MKEIIIRVRITESKVAFLVEKNTEENENYI
jgi:hypothetical protein